MNLTTMPIMKRFIVHILGLAFVAVALLLGLGVGNLANPSRPAQATVPTEAPCSVFCADGSESGVSGEGGNVPSLSNTTSGGGNVR